MDLDRWLSIGAFLISLGAVWYARRADQRAAIQMQPELMVQRRRDLEDAWEPPVRFELLNRGLGLANDVTVRFAFDPDTVLSARLWWTTVPPGAVEPIEVGIAPDKLAFGGAARRVTITWTTTGGKEGSWSGDWVQS